MTEELIRLSAREAVERLKSKEISPLDLLDAAERRIAAVEPHINALPTLCLDRARGQAKRLAEGRARDAEREAGWLAGLPVAHDLYLDPRVPEFGVQARFEEPAQAPIIDSTR